MKAAHAVIGGNGSRKSAQQIGKPQAILLGNFIVSLRGALRATKQPRPEERSAERDCFAPLAMTT
jgi:hypothetical protein